MHPNVEKTKEGAKLLTQLKNIYKNIVAFDAEIALAEQILLETRKRVSDENPEIIAKMSFHESDEDGGEYFKYRKRLQRIILQDPEAKRADVRFNELLSKDIDRSLTREMEGRFFELEESSLSKEDANNWQEKEADEIGLEMYLRSGFVFYHFSSRNLSYIGLSKYEMQECFKLSPFLYLQGMAIRLRGGQGRTQQIAGVFIIY